MPADMYSDRDAITRRTAYILYLCHLLSTWNARMYEFAAVVFTAAAFPESLTASSLFGITMSLSVLLFASLLGTWVDRGQSRLTTLISTITANRISVIAACICWFFIVGLQEIGSQSKASDAINSSGDVLEAESIDLALGFKNSLFVLVLLLSIVERLSRTANLFSIERDWVPAMVNPEALTKNDELPSEFGLTELNAVMSRIDLVCKLLSPIAMSAFISAVGSVKIGILAVLGLNGLTWTAEIWSARSVWKSSDRLQELKRLDTEEGELNGIAEAVDTSIGSLSKINTNASWPWWQRSSQRAYEAFQTARGGVTTWLRDYAVNLHIYFGHAVWLPSMALSILHFSVLNYSATLTVYLLSSGFSLNLITVAKALSAVAEIGSTFFTPWGVRQTKKVWARRENITLSGGMVPIPGGDEEGEDLLSEREQDDPEATESAFAPQADMGVAVLGLWSLMQMLISLIPACLALWILSFSTRSSSPEKPFPPSTIITILLLTTIPFSRFGRWTNHLTTQQLTQTLVPPTHRSAFAGAEMGFVSLFGLGHWVITAIWSKHEQFRWLALGSVAAVGCSVGIYVWWLRGEGKGGPRGRMGFLPVPGTESS